LTFDETRIEFYGIFLISILIDQNQKTMNCFVTHDLDVL